MKKNKKRTRKYFLFIRAIFRLIDKKIITPITKFILMISDKMARRTDKFERWLVKRNTLVFFFFKSSTILIQSPIDWNLISSALININIILSVINSFSLRNTTAFIVSPNLARRSISWSFQRFKSFILDLIYKIVTSNCSLFSNSTYFNRLFMCFPPSTIILSGLIDWGLTSDLISSNLFS